MKKNLFLNFISFFFLISCNLEPGSYPYAEKYKFAVNEKKLILTSRKFKEINPQYIVPSKIGLIDGRTDSNDKWHHVYFYFPNEDEIIYTWIRSESNNTSTFALVSINKGKTLGNWKDINKDFDNHENNLNKKKFEERILSKIKLMLNK